MVANGSVLADTKVNAETLEHGSWYTAGANLYRWCYLRLLADNDNPIFRGYDDSGSTVNSMIDNKGNDAFFLISVLVSELISYSKSRY